MWSFNSVMVGKLWNRINTVFWNHEGFSSCILAQIRIYLKYAKASIQGPTSECLKGKVTIYFKKDSMQILTLCRIYSELNNKRREYNRHF